MCIRDRLFYIQRDPNTNTICYELNVDKNGKFEEEDPVHVFWIRYPEGGMRKELNFIPVSYTHLDVYKRQPL